LFPDFCAAARDIALANNRRMRQAALITQANAQRKMVLQATQSDMRSRSMIGWADSRAVLVIASVFIRFILERAYAAMMPTEFSYAGFYYTPTLAGTLMSYVGVIAMAAIMPRKVMPSTIALNAYFVGFYIPLSMVVAAKDQYFDFFAMSTGFLLLLRLLITIVKVERPISRNLAYSNQLLILISVSGVILTLILFVSQGGLQYVNFDIEDVYSVREDINSILTGFVGYLSDWSKNVFLPIILIISIYTKRLYLIFFSLLLFVGFFAITSSKAVLFYPLVVLFLTFLVRTGHAVPLLYAGVAGVALTSHFMYVVFGQNIVSALMTLRVFSVPPSDALLYYDYFQTHDLLYWSNTILGAPFRTQEFEHIAQTIGRNSWGYGSETFANTGVFATSYMQFGILGMIIYPILIAVVLKLVDKLAFGRMPLESAVCISIIPLLQFLGSDFPTAMLSHGVAMLLICMRLLVLDKGKPGAA
jgi:hypothetical protein